MAKKQKSKDKERDSISLLSKAQKKITSKRFLKNQGVTVVMKEREPFSVLGEPNRFFKHELNEMKRSMFFS